jgi:hypothetical protein
MEKHNLQTRLGLIMLVFFAIAMAGAVLRAVILADDMIETELESSASLVDRMFTMAELEEDSPFNHEN